MKDAALEESIEVSAVDKSHARAIRKGREANWLTRRGFDGLYCVGQCACRVDDLYPCGERQDCSPGVLMDCDCGEGCGWHIGSKRIKELREHGDPNGWRAKAVAHD